MQDIAGNSEAIILDRLTPGTQYSIAVTAVWLGKKYRSRQVIFRTLGKKINSHLSNTYFTHQIHKEELTESRNFNSYYFNTI